MPEDEDDFEERPVTRRDRVRAWGPLAVVLTLFGSIGALMFAGFVGMVSDHRHVADYSRGRCAADDPHKVLVEVKMGASGEAIGQALFDAGVVRSPEAFVDAVGHNKNGRDIAAGTYKVCSRISGATAVTELLNAANLSADSVIEVKAGDYSWETLRALASKRGWDRSDLQQAIDANEIGLPAWSKTPDGKWTVEGMLEPGRYTLSASDTPAGVLTGMVKARVTTLTGLGLDAKAPALKCGMHARPCTPEEALIIASIAEAEVTKVEPDGHEVSEVLQARLNKGYWLGVDATTKYWMSLQAGKRVEPTKREVEDLADPYSTGRRAGLPPTPISIPSKQMVAAVLAPTKDGWFFWCGASDGTHFFKGDQQEEFSKFCANPQ